MDLKVWHIFNVPRKFDVTITERYGLISAFFVSSIGKKNESFYVKLYINDSFDLAFEISEEKTAAKVSYRKNSFYSLNKVFYNSICDVYPGVKHFYLNLNSHNLYEFQPVYEVK